jgi:hypothetical protein
MAIHRRLPAPNPTDQPTTTHEPTTTTTYTKHHPNIRVLDFLLAEPARPRFCLWWAALLLLFTRGVVPVSHALKLRRILVRKLFHVLAVVMFVPATHAQVCYSFFFNWNFQGWGERGVKPMGRDLA